MTKFVDLQLIDGLDLPYAPGAEAALVDSDLDTVFNDAWQAFVAIFPGLTLEPLFNEIPVEQLADLVDGIRLNGHEPPNPFVWFTLSCDESVVAAVVAAAQALPMVVFAEERIGGIPASTISYGTNPEASATLQIQPAPKGVDAIYAWQVVGGTGQGIHVADIEKGWRLDHDDLLTARITKLSVFGSPTPPFVDHGTAMAGIVIAADNGVGTVGIAPGAELELTTDQRQFGVGNTALAIEVAAANLARGDVLLLELALPFLPPFNKADVPIELDRAVQGAIGRATQRGITVIEPAGNGGVNLDTSPAFAHMRPGSPTFVNSGAIMVGAGVDTAPASGTWSRTFSSFGSRVDCFAVGGDVRVLSSAATDAYQNVSGTSPASAIIAGVVASLQAMTIASRIGVPGSSPVLAPSDVSNIFRSARLGTLPADPLGAKIGTMPDLRRITRAQGLIRVLPIGAAAIGGNALLIVHLDADNRMVRRHFTLLTGWGQPIPTMEADGTRSASDDFELIAAQPAVNSSDEDAPLSRLKFDAFFSGPLGIHHMFWDSGNQSGNVSRPIAPITAAAQGRALAAIRARIDLQVLAAISPQGRLVILTGDPQILLSSTSAPLVIDAVGSYRRVAGPAIVSRGAGLADVVVIEDGGSLNWFTGRLPAVVGTGWTGPVTEPSGVVFDPGARPALLVNGSVLLAAAVASGGSLHVATIDPVTSTIDSPVEVDPTVTIDTFGPVALGLTAVNVVAVAVDTTGTLRAAARLIAGGPWTPLVPIPSLLPVTVSPLGGVTAVTIDFGVMVIAVGVDGLVCFALSVDGLIWSPLVPLP